MISNTEHQADANQAVIFQDIILSLGTVLHSKTMLSRLVEHIVTALPCDRAIVLVADDENVHLNFGAISPALENADIQKQLEGLSVTLYNASATSVVGSWLAGSPQTLTADSDPGDMSLAWLMAEVPVVQRYGQPILHGNRLVGVIIVDSQELAFTDAALTHLHTIARAAAVLIENGRLYSRTIFQAETHMRELTILRQIDRELNDTIEPQHVFQMTLDWALRFTNAHAASIGLYEQDTDEFRIMATYGYDIPPEQIALIRAQRGGIAQRVARSAYTEIVPDVSLDKDFIRGASLTHSQLSVPVTREDRVIAVISVESKKINGFTDEHQDFVEKLAARAGVAIDNARLFDATAREREKLSAILNNTADIVIVVGPDDRIILINPAAYNALRLYPTESYVGHKVQEAFAETNFLDSFRRAQASNDPVIEEVEMPNGRVFHMNLTRHENVGRIVVMHDITPFKEMDQLKSELIATVSHDLKQPLAVMNGYTELLLMHKKMDESGISFIEMVRKSIQNMRQLIDDLLDLAKIETGIQLNLNPVEVEELVGECIDSLQPMIMSKDLTVKTRIPDDLPLLRADRSRLQQILLNLISNAVKYTPPEGKVQIVAENRDSAVRILIVDNGMGISPEDQAHIFERFYRVRRPETDSIEGTGLGLAIVKSLVEAHHGQIGLESRLGEGTTFFLTLPTIPNETEEPVVTAGA